MVRFIRLTGARCTTVDDKTVYTPRGDIYINRDQVVCFYDHTVIVAGHPIRVMDEEKELYRKIALTP